MNFINRANSLASLFIDRPVYVCVCVCVLNSYLESCLEFSKTSQYVRNFSKSENVQISALKYDRVEWQCKVTRVKTRTCVLHANYIRYFVTPRHSFRPVSTICSDICSPALLPSIKGESISFRRNSLSSFIPLPCSAKNSPRANNLTTKCTPRSCPSPFKNIHRTLEKWHGLKTTSFPSSGNAIKSLSPPLPPPRAPRGIGERSYSFRHTRPLLFTKKFARNNVSTSKRSGGGRGRGRGRGGETVLRGNHCHDKAWGLAPLLSTQKIHHAYSVSARDPLSISPSTCNL